MGGRARRGRGRPDRLERLPSCFDSNGRTSGPLVAPIRHARVARRLSDASDGASTSVGHAGRHRADPRRYVAQHVARATPTGRAGSIARATLVERDLLPSLAPRFHPELLRFGERLAPGGDRRRSRRRIGARASARRSRPCAIATADVPSPASSCSPTAGTTATSTRRSKRLAVRRCTPSASARRPSRAIARSSA